MKKKISMRGFTLIELLAVILILAIIALIAIPVITSVISDSEKGALKSTVQNLIKSVENNCNVEKINGTDVTYVYKLTEQGVLPSVVELKGKLPTSGYIYVDDECNANAVNLSDGKNYVNGTVQEMEVESEAKNTSPVADTTTNHLFVIDGIVIPESFDINQMELNILTINGTFSDSDDNVVMNYMGYISKDLNISNIKTFAEQLKTKELMANGNNLYEEIYYYIDYENSYSYVFFNACILSGVCNNSTNVYDALELPNDAAFIEIGGIINKF